MAPYSALYGRYLEGWGICLNGGRLEGLGVRGRGEGSAAGCFSGF